ncbi:uncharacterized protein LOC125674737 isoform X4 [Ostrea edulis]|uniref:uncharacterized protein LOC125674737 isoform X4 n=1 Tax=Ostrea edulis TaxID=37623 RepID=UPI0024AEB172|nr:uncharacterized protein LOC125674737 isoform X4 [Ostrea edulis]
MEVETNKRMDSNVGIKILNKTKSTPFQKRIASIAFKTGDDVTDWMNAGNRATASIKTPKYGLRRRPPKLPSPLVRLPPSSISDTPTTMTTDSASRSTYVTLRGSSITPYAFLNSETSRTKSTIVTDNEILSKKDATNTDRSTKASLSQKEVLGPIKPDGKRLPLKSHTSMDRHSNGSLEIAKISESAPLQRMESKKSLVHPTFRHMSYTNRTRTSVDDGEFNINPEPVPYQPQNFMSSTLLKKVPIPKRHLDSFGGYEYSLGSKRGVILHTDRYQRDGALVWDAPKSFEGMSQRDRLKAELEYMERLRGIKRRREMLPHRAQLDLLMGGKKVEFSERFDIQREIQKLKSLIMPKNARDLFHGRGFQLPDQHSSLRPRQPPILDYDSDEDTSVPSSHRLGKQVIDPDTGLPKPRLKPNAGQLPRIVNRNVIGSTESPLLLAREKRTVDQIKARISIPAELQRGRRPISIKTHDMAQEAPRFSEDGPWGTHELFARQGRKYGMSPAHLKRSRTNIQSKIDSVVNRSATLPETTNSQLNLTTKNDAVKRVEIPSAVHPKSRGTEKAEPMLNYGKNPLDIDNLKENLPEQDVADLERIESRLSGRSKLADSPMKAATPNPLKGSELSRLLPEEQKDELKKAFHKLDTDADGHLMYQQLKSQLPPQMTSQQERFLKQVYDITSSSTFFGVDEFMTMSTLTKKVQNLRDEAADSFNSLDFSLLHNNIIKYVDLFQSVDRNQRGKISLDSLQEVLSTALEADLSADDKLWSKTLDIVDPDEGGKITKIEYLAHIPYFLTLKLNPEPGSVPNAGRFQ